MASDAQIRASVAHNKKMGSITLRPSKELDEQIRQAAQAAGENLSGYILEAVRRRMVQDGYTPEQAGQTEQAAQQD